MRIALGCDHRGRELKQSLVAYLEAGGHTCEDLGWDDESPVDYPDFAGEVGRAVTQGRCERGILVCSTGVGMSIAANKVKGVRAALCHDAFTCRRAREHNDANVLCLGAEVVDVEMAEELVDVFLATKFEGGRHLRRVEKIHQMERAGFLDT
ncbi:MAG: ribose 5-phosphate isomerase B [Chloroflexota bacterium]